MCPGVYIARQFGVLYRDPYCMHIEYVPLHSVNLIIRSRRRMINIGYQNMLALYIHKSVMHINFMTIEGPETFIIREYLNI